MHMFTGFHSVPTLMEFIVSVWQLKALGHLIKHEYGMHKYKKINSIIYCYSYLVIQSKVTCIYTHTQRLYVCKLGWMCNLTHTCYMGCCARVRAHTHGIYSARSATLSKILEKVVLHKLLSHLQDNNLSNSFQSAYRAGHSTETVLLRIVNDGFSALDDDNISVLLLLDHSADFDTMDHQILLSRLNSVLGIQSTALQWFQSCLSEISPLQ